MSRVWQGLAMAIALAAMTAGGVVIVQDGDPPAGTATIWADADGGTCVDNASPVEYDTATACSLDGANDTCDNGETVMVVGGTYAAFDITGSNSRSSNCVFQTVDGDTVNVNGNADFSGSRLSWQGDDSYGSSFTVTSGSAAPAASQATVSFNSTSSFLTIDDWKACPGKVWLAGVDLNVSNAEWGCYDTYPNGTQEHDCLLGGANANIPERVVFTNIYLHACHRTVNSPDFHTDCMHLRGFIDLTITRSRIQDCPQSAGILAQIGGAGSLDNLTIENTFLGPLQGTVMLNLCTAGDPAMTATIRHNTIAGGLDNTCTGTQTFTGNILGSQETGCTGSYSYNTWTSGSCGTNAQTCSAAFVSSGSPNFDYHLQSGDTCAKGNGNDADKPATDFDGDARSTDVDIGADEIG